MGKNCACTTTWWVAAISARSATINVIFSGRVVHSSSFIDCPYTFRYNSWPHLAHLCWVSVLNLKCSLYYPFYPCWPHRIWYQLTSQLISQGLLFCFIISLFCACTWSGELFTFSLCLLIRYLSLFLFLTFFSLNPFLCHSLWCWYTLLVQDVIRDGFQIDDSFGGNKCPQLIGLGRRPRDRPWRSAEREAVGQQRKQSHRAIGSMWRGLWS